GKAAVEDGKTAPEQRPQPRENSLGAVDEPPLFSLTGGRRALARRARGRCHCVLVATWAARRDRGDHGPSAGSAARRGPTSAPSRGPRCASTRSAARSARTSSSASSSAFGASICSASSRARRTSSRTSLSSAREVFGSPKVPSLGGGGGSEVRETERGGC